MKKIIPLVALLSIISTSIFAQGGLGGNIRFGANFLGFNAGVPGDLQIHNNFAGQPINFFAGNSGAPLFTPLQRMTILGTTGFVGIGLTAPAFPLDVQDRINITNNNALGFGYFINGFDVLQVPGTENTFVGKGTGANASMSPPTPFVQENTFVGFQAGGSDVNGDRNTFIGRAAGFANINGRFNTFIGCDAGLNLVTGNENTFVGEHAGFRQISGNNNVFVGGHSGQAPAIGGTGSDNTFLGTYCGPDNLNGSDNTYSGFKAGNNCNTGNRNCFYGKWSGFLTSTGDDNVFLGYLADRYNRGGDSCTFIGNYSGVASGLLFQNLNNANGFGSNAIARASNTMILGSNSVKVGIGLSDDITPANGPTNKLEIDAGLNLTAAQPSGLAGASGLRFRDLHLGNTPSIANGVVLSVDGNGDVILVPAGSGTITGAENGASISTIITTDVAWGQDVGQAGNPGILLSDREIPQNSFNIQFIDLAAPLVGTNRVSFGQPIPATQSTKFYVFNNI